jgi:FAD/FMN-containing dehydrogenase
MNDSDISDLAAGLRGQVIRTGDAGYDDARSLYNGMIDKRPLLIARCADVADVIAAVNFGRNSKLPIAIRGGGHNGPGLGSVDDGLVIDLGMMKGVRVDPEARTARVGAGCTTGDVDHATHAFGQAIPFGIISSTGVAGLTLSGGHGYLTRQYGLVVDNLIEADVVLADGSFVVASETQNADLFWALRGGGGNFGVVTSFLFRTNPAKMLYAGPIAFSVDDAAEIMRWYRDFERTAPNDFYIFLGLQAIPPTAPFPEEHWNKKMCVLLVAHNGADGEAAVNAIRKELPTPYFDWCGPMPYTALQTLFDPFYPKGLQWYWKGAFVKELPDAAITAHVESAKKANVFSAMHLYPIDGAVHAKGASDTAWQTRDAVWSMVIVGLSPDASDRGAIKEWATGYYNAVKPYNLPGGYPNFMMADEAARLKATFGDNYPKLQSIKMKYDPRNLFRVNHNIVPA